MKEFRSFAKDIVSAEKSLKLAALTVTIFGMSAGRVGTVIPDARRILKAAGQAREGKAEAN